MMIFHSCFKMLYFLSLSHMSSFFPPKSVQCVLIPERSLYCHWFLPNILDISMRPGKLGVIDQWSAALLTNLWDRQGKQVSQKDSLSTFNIFEYYTAPNHFSKENVSLTKNEKQICAFLTPLLRILYCPYIIRIVNSKDLCPRI